MRGSERSSERLAERLESGRDRTFDRCRSCLASRQQVVGHVVTPFFCISFAFASRTNPKPATPIMISALNDF
jgi:hypothetical protein